MKTTWFQKGMSGKFVSKNKQTLRKEKYKKTTETPKVFLQKGVHGQKAKKTLNFERECKRKTSKKENRIKDGFGRQAFRVTKEKNL